MRLVFQDSQRRVWVRHEFHRVIQELNALNIEKFLFGDALPNTVLGLICLCNVG